MAVKIKLTRLGKIRNPQYRVVVADARTRRDGRAIAFCAPEEMGELKDIQKVMKREIPVASGTPWERIAPPQGQGAKPAGGGRGKPKPGGARRAQQRRRSRGGQGRGKGQAA